MTKLMLDTSVLVHVCGSGHPDVKDWFRRLLLSPAHPELIVSVLAEYELRRAFARRGADEGVSRFEEIAKTLRSVPVSREATVRAAALVDVSDADAIIAAQALGENAVMVSSDLSFRSVPGLTVREWNQIDPERLPP